MRALRVIFQLGVTRDSLDQIKDLLLRRSRFSSECAIGATAASELIASGRLIRFPSRDRISRGGR